MDVPIDISGGIGHALAAFGYRELDQRWVMQRVVKPGMSICEIGANIGYYIAMYGKLTNRQVRIAAFEPDPQNLPILRRNISLNGMEGLVTVNATAMSDHTGVATFYQGGSPNLSGLALSTMKRKYVSSVSVSTLAFDEYLKSLNGRLDLLRMDIEGHEVAVFRSLVRYLKDKSPAIAAPQTIVFEPHSWEYDSHEMKTILSEMFACGYRATYLATADERYSPLLPLRYVPHAIISSPTNGRLYGIYEGVRPSDAARVISGSPGLTTVCLQRNC